ncbi:LysM peptidoglycan-binding domain-containing protein [Persephonella sp.]
MNKKVALTVFVIAAVYFYLKKQKAEKEKPVYYKVQKGDTLSKIAQQFGMDWRQLAKLNKLKNPNLIRVNQIIRIK